MGIDTVTLRYELNIDGAKYIIDRLVIYSPDREKILHKFLFDSEENFGKPIYGRDINGLNAGIQAITMYRNKMYPNTFYLCITINLSALLTNNETVKLFTATQQNIYVLQMNYASAIAHLFPKCFQCSLKYHKGYPFRAGLACIPYLALASVKVIAFTANFKIPEHKDETLYMLQHSALASTQEQQDYKNRNTYQKNKSCTDTVYDKELKCKDKGSPTEQYYKEAKNILRYEHTQRSDIKELIGSRFVTAFYEEQEDNLYYFGVLAFLNQTKIEQYIIYKYSNVFRLHDWYSLDVIQSKILSSSFQAAVKKRMIALTTKCLDKSTGLNDLRQMAKSSGKGTLHSFNVDINRFDKLGIQPVPIPECLGTSQIKNPISLVEKSQLSPVLVLPDFSKDVLKCFIQNLKIINVLDAKQKNLPSKVWKQSCIKYFTVTFVVFYIAFVGLCSYQMFNIREVHLASRPASVRAPPPKFLHIYIN